MRRAWTEGDPENNGGYGGGSAPSFSDLQGSGRARPPAPIYGGGSPLSGGPPSTTPGAFPTPRPITVAPPPPPVYAPHIITTKAGEPVPSDNGGTPMDGGGQLGDTGNPGESDFEKQLRERYQSSPNAPEFTAGARAQTAATFVPGANPFTPSDAFQPGQFSGATTPVGAAQFTPGASAITVPFRPGQFAGSDATTSTVDPAILKSVMDLLANPSGYTTDAATSTYNRLGGAIDDQYNVDNQHIDEDMARRGLSVSTIGAGRLADSNVARKSAKEDLAGRILTDQASTLGADRARAIATASGMSDDQFNRLLAEYNTNTAAGQQGFANTVTAAGVNEGLATDKFNADQTSNEFTSSEAQRQFNDALAAFNTNTAAGQQGFANKVTAAGVNEGLATDKFNADQTGNQFNSSENQRGFNDALSAFGANQTAGAQNFGQTEQKLADYLGFGQNSFNNQQTVAGTNNAQQQQLIQLLQQLFGGTGGGGTA